MKTYKIKLTFHNLGRDKIKYIFSESVSDSKEEILPLIEEWKKKIVESSTKRLRFKKASWKESAKTLE